MDEIRRSYLKDLFGELQKEIHQNAKDKGFWPELEGVDMNDNIESETALNKVNVGEKLALCQSALSKALEASRKESYEQDEHCPAFTNFSIELADAVIRIMDLTEANGIPLIGAIMTKFKFNKTRPHKHGKRF